jgi:hypothetical protein
MNKKSKLCSNAFATSGTSEAATKRRRHTASRILLEFLYGLS